MNAALGTETTPLPLLAVRDLAVSFVTDGGVLRALDGVSFEVPRGKTLALVGESGCGKSVTAQSILRLLPSPPARIEAGDIFFEGENLLSLGETAMREVRGGRIGMVFQEPMTSLNPVYTIGFQIGEAVRLHRRASRKEVKTRVLELLASVHFPDPPNAIDSYPHELSGGMRQRVLIAMAIASEPALLIADEPTTALDATIQAQILELLRELKDRLAMSLLLVTHDFGIVAQMADAVVVMYAGQIVERGTARDILRSPAHPYTRALIGSIPPERAYRVRGQKGRRLPTIDGSLPDLRERPVGCRFAPRCTEAWELCRTEEPKLIALENGGESRCFLNDPEKRRESGTRERETGAT